MANNYSKYTRELIESKQMFLFILRNNKRQKKEELSVLLQGTELPPARPIAEEPLLPAKYLPVEAPSHQHEEHQYTEPRNTAGEAHRRRRGAVASSVGVSSPVAALPYQPVQEYVYSAEELAEGVLLPKPNTPRTTEWRRKKRQQEAQNTNGGAKHTYERKKNVQHIEKVWEPRIATTGHSQYKSREGCSAPNQKR